VHHVRGQYFVSTVEYFTQMKLMVYFFGFSGYKFHWSIPLNIFGWNEWIPLLVDFLMVKSVLVTNGVGEEVGTYAVHERTSALVYLKRVI